MTIALSILAALILLVLIGSLICFLMAFYAPRSKPSDPDEVPLPPGKIYEPYHDQLTQWVLDARALPRQDFKIRSFDGLDLWGTYYEYAPGAPIELMFHGYRGAAERDLSGGVQRCFALKRSAFIVDQRCSGRSGGHVITFGIREHRDCLKWVDFMVEHFGPDVKIILTGISMGASTVLTAAGYPLPSNIIGVLADCGFSSPKAIICRTIREMKLPDKLIYPLVRLGAALYGHFNLEEITSLQTLKRCQVPVIFFHGETDDFVPAYMSRENYDACASRKELVTIPGAGHGLSFPAAPQRYIQALADFFGPEASAQ